MSTFQAEATPISMRLKEARKRLGVSQERLGILAGIDVSSASARINQHERATHTPKFLIACRLAEVLGVPVTYLYANDDELAELILLFSKASQSRKSEVLELLKSSPSL